METLALSAAEEVLAANGKKHFSSTSCDKSSFSLSKTESGMGALLGRKRSRRNCVSDTNTSTGSLDELAGERRREKAGRGRALRQSYIAP